MEAGQRWVDAVQCVWAVSEDARQSATHQPEDRPDTPSQPEEESDKRDEDQAGALASARTADLAV